LDKGGRVVTLTSHLTLEMSGVVTACPLYSIMVRKETTALLATLQTLQTFEPQRILG
jgi:hypothetical protein